MSSLYDQPQTLVLFVVVTATKAGSHGLGIFFDSHRFCAYNLTERLDGPQEHQLSNRDALLKGILVALRRAPKYYSLKVEVEDREVVAELDRAAYNRSTRCDPQQVEDFAIKAVLDQGYARANYTGTGVNFIYSGLDVTAAGGLGKARELALEAASQQAGQQAANAAKL